MASDTLKMPNNLEVLPEGEINPNKRA